MERTSGPAQFTTSLAVRRNRPQGCWRAAKTAGRFIRGFQRYLCDLILFCVLALPTATLIVVIVSSVRAISMSSTGRVSASSVRDRLLEAGKVLFSTRGYDNASTVSLARLAATSE